MAIDWVSPKPLDGRVTAAAGVVGMQPADLVEPQQPAEVGERGIERAAEPLLEARRRSCR